MKTEVEDGYRRNLENLNPSVSSVGYLFEPKELDLCLKYGGFEVNSAALDAFDFVTNPDVRFPPLELDTQRLSTRWTVRWRH